MMGRTYIFDRAGIIFIAVLVFTFYFSVVFVSAADQPLLVYRQKAIVPQDKLTLSHDFSVSLQRGSSVYSYPFEVPNGVNGLQPDVRLTYNHQRIKGAPRITGAGWVLSQNYVERVVDGDHYDPEKRIYFLHLNGETHELIDDESDSGYTTKRKNFWHIEKFVDGVEIECRPTLDSSSQLLQRRLTLYFFTSRRVRGV